MALQKQEIPKFPDEYCTGIVSDVTNLRESESGNQVIDIVLTPIAAPRTNDQRVFLVFQPEWFASDFNPSGLEKGPSFLYNKMVGRKGSRNTGTLPGILGDGYDEFLAAVDANGAPTEEEVFDLLRQHMVGIQVGFVIQQRTESEKVLDENGDEKYVKFRTDQTEVGNFFFAGDVEAIEKRAKRQKAKAEADEDFRPSLRVHWDVDAENPLMEGQNVGVAV